MFFSARHSYRYRLGWSYWAVITAWPIPHCRHVTGHQYVVIWLEYNSHFHACHRHYVIRMPPDCNARRWASFEYRFLLLHIPLFHCNYSPLPSFAVIATNTQYRHHANVCWPSILGFAATHPVLRQPGHHPFHWVSHQIA